MDRRSIPDVLKAAIRGDLDAVKTALESVDLTKARNVYEDNLLHLTSDCNRPQVLAHILSRPDCKKFINQRNCIRRTPLHAACKAGSVDCVELLLAAGAIASVKDRQGNTPRQLAERAGYTQVTECLDRWEMKHRNERNRRKELRNGLLDLQSDKVGIEQFLVFTPSESHTTNIGRQRESERSNRER
jgi:ankyrin repeat protein